MLLISLVRPMAMLLTVGTFAGASIVTDPADVPDDLNGSNFTYPYPVHIYNFTSQFQELEMAFMDVPPANGTKSCTEKVAVVLHGRYFCGATWVETIGNLTAAGYRVIAPDQVGFCKSSKPARYQFTLSQLALNTASLLQALGIANVTVIGHSMGGMLAARFTLQYPTNVTKLVMVDPLGLEDWIAVGVPYESIDANWVSENAATYASIKAYQQATYYDGTWDPRYDVWVNMLVNIYYGSQRTNFLVDQAEVVDMVLTQPLIQHFDQLKPPALLMVGDKDNTAIGKPWSPPDVQARLGHYNILGPQAAALIPNSTYVHFPALGHAPQIQDPAAFHTQLLGWLVNGTVQVTNGSVSSV
jgi:pimeloyl-ACP methyl ester carboxylesterase